MIVNPVTDIIDKIIKSFIAQSFLKHTSKQQPTYNVVLKLNKVMVLGLTLLQP